MQKRSANRTAGFQKARSVGGLEVEKVANRQKKPCRTGRVAPTLVINGSISPSTASERVKKMLPKITVADAANYLEMSPQAVLQTIHKKNIPLSKQGRFGYFTHETAKQLFGIEWNPRGQIIAVQVVKGGPGKTSIVKNLGIRLNLYGARVLLVDLDQQGNLTNDFIDSAEEIPVMFDLLDPKGGHAIDDAIQNILPGLDLIPSRLENSALDQLMTMERLPLDRVFKDILDPLRKRYDFILIDCPPALSQSVTAAALAADRILIPVAPEKYCMAGLKMTHDELKKLEKRYGRPLPFRVVINKFDSGTTLSKEILGVLMSLPAFKDQIMGQLIRHCEEIPKTAAGRVSLYETSSHSRAAEDFDLLTRELIQLSTEARQATTAVRGRVPLEAPLESRA